MLMLLLVLLVLLVLVLLLLMLQLLLYRPGIEPGSPLTQHPRTQGGRERRARVQVQLALLYYECE
jgi:hypothetical protein